MMTQECLLHADVMTQLCFVECKHDLPLCLLCTAYMHTVHCMFIMFQHGYMVKLIVT